MDSGAFRLFGDKFILDLLRRNRDVVCTVEIADQLIDEQRMQILHFPFNLRLPQVCDFDVLALIGILCRRKQFLLLIGYVLVDCTELHERFLRRFVGTLVCLTELPVRIRDTGIRLYNHSG